MKALVFFAVSALFLVLLVLVHRRLLGRLNLKWSGDHYDLVPWIELILSLVYVYWAVYFFFRGDQYFSYMLFILSIAVVGIILFIVTKDYVPGLSVRMDHRFRTGSTVEINGEKAEILKLGVLSMTLQTEHGTNLFMPYSKIHTLSYQARTREEADIFCFNMEIPYAEDLEKSLEKIRIICLTSPWIPVHSEPRITRVDKGEGGHNVEICVHAISARHAAFVEKKIARALRLARQER
jgi:small-conductance mechanosensitive channel